MIVTQNARPLDAPRVAHAHLYKQVNTETTPLGQYLLRRQAKADRYVGSERAAFFDGWDKAIEEVGLILQAPGGDGCFCVHHPDDPAHTADCYYVVEYLLLEQGRQ